MLLDTLGVSGGRKKTRKPDKEGGLLHCFLKIFPTAFFPQPFGFQVRRWHG